MVENTDDNNDMIQISDNESPSEFDSDVASLTSANSGSTDRAYSSIRTRLRHRAHTESDLEAMAAASLSSRRPATTSQQTTEDEAINLASSISYPTSVGGEASGGMPTIRDRFDYWFSEPHRSRIHSSHEQGLSAANGRSSSATSDGSSLTTENVLSSVATGRTAYTNIFPSHVQGQVEWDREQIARAQQAERDRNRLLRDHDRDRPRVFSSTRELDFASNASTREPFRYDTIYSWINFIYLISYVILKIEFAFVKCLVRYRIETYTTRITSSMSTAPLSYQQYFFLFLSLFYL